MNVEMAISLQNPKVLNLVQILDMITQAPKELWLQALEKLDRFSRLAPWQWMGDGQVFGVYSTEWQEWAYVSIMGMAGEFRGIALYIGAEGLKSLEMLTNETLPPDAQFKQRALVAGFHRPADLEGETQQLLKHLGRKYGPKELAPEVHSHQPGFVAWSPDVSELKGLVEVMDGIQLVCGELEQDPTYLASSDGILELEGLTFENGKWEKLTFNPDRGDIFRPNLPQWQKESVQMALSGLKKRQCNLLFEQFHIPRPVNEGSRPFFPKCVMLVDLDSGMIVGAELVKMEDLINDLPKILPKMLRDLGFIPSDWITSTKESFSLVRNFAHTAGMDIHLDEELEIREDLLSHLMDSMG